jgi:hypothetical protein
MCRNIGIFFIDGEFYHCRGLNLEVGPVFKERMIVLFHTNDADPQANFS